MASLFILGINEYYSYKQNKALQEIKSNMIILSDENNTYNKKYENKAVLIYGYLAPKEDIKDSDFGVKYNGILLDRKITMYQWQKTKDGYTKIWSSKHINSSSFDSPKEHHNPPMNFKDKRFINKKAQIGDFTISQDIIDEINTQNMYSYHNISSIVIDRKDNYKKIKSILYIGDDENTPKVGDLKIEYKGIENGHFAIIGRIKNTNIIKYITKDQTSYTKIVTYSSMDSKKILENITEDDNTIRWLFRIIGVILLFLAYKGLLSLKSLFNI